MSYRCPKCGGKEFEAAATERVSWILDEYGDYKETGDFLDVVDRPSNDELCMCTNCYHEGLGSDFIVEEQN